MRHSPFVLGLSVSNINVECKSCKTSIYPKCVEFLYQNRVFSLLQNGIYQCIGQREREREKESANISYGDSEYQEKCIIFTIHPSW